jgi:hypothetical protein
VAKLSLADLLMAAGVWNPSCLAAGLRAGPCGPAAACLLLDLLLGPTPVKEERREGAGVRNSPLLSSLIGSRLAAALERQAAAPASAAAASAASCATPLVVLRDRGGVAKASALLPPLDQAGEWNASELPLPSPALPCLSLLASWNGALLKLDLRDALGVRNARSSSCSSSCSCSCSCCWPEAMRHRLPAPLVLACAPGARRARCKLPASLPLLDGTGVM